MWLFSSEQVWERACYIIKWFPTVFGIGRLLWESESIHSITALWRSALNYINHFWILERNPLFTVLGLSLSLSPSFTSLNSHSFLFSSISFLPFDSWWLLFISNNIQFFLLLLVFLLSLWLSSLSLLDMVFLYL